MYVGGNEKARKYFRMQGVRDMNGQGKYNSKAARLYKKQVQQLYSKAKTPPTSPATGPSSSVKAKPIVGGDEGLDRMLAEMGLNGATTTTTQENKKNDVPVVPPTSPSGTFSLSAAIARNSPSPVLSYENKDNAVVPLRLPEPVVKDEKKAHSNGKLSATVGLNVQKSEASEEADSEMLMKLMRKTSGAQSKSKRKGRRRKKLGGVRLE